MTLRARNTLFGMQQILRLLALQAITGQVRKGTPWKLFEISLKNVARGVFHR